MTAPEKHSPEALFQLLETTNNNVLNIRTDVTNLQTDFNNHKTSTSKNFENLSEALGILNTSMTNHTNNSDAEFEGLRTTLENYRGACTTNFEAENQSFLRIDGRLNFMRRGITRLTRRLSNFEMNNNQNVPGNAGLILNIGDVNLPRYYAN
ncbi:unnamed protein product [Meloidogyne enterolobii]|uniref:Uncharacterized protein n=1 Tax=Meloidogyne enterolobii TaxID=390850 RepID=A0ACB1A6X6_MELEN